MKTIQVQVRNVYGNDLIYPVCEDAKRFTYLTNTTTLPRDVITIIKELGYKIETVAQEI